MSRRIMKKKKVQQLIDRYTKMEISKLKKKKDSK